MRIYVAGPATAKTAEEIRANARFARSIGEQILLKGHLPYVPHTHFSDWEIDIEADYELLLEHGMQMLRHWAEALFFIGHSRGADKELQEAKKLGLVIYYHLSDIPEA